MGTAGRFMMVFGLLLVASGCGSPDEVNGDSTAPASESVPGSPSVSPDGEPAAATDESTTTTVSTTTTSEPVLETVAPDVVLATAQEASALLAALSPDEPTVPASLEVGLDRELDNLLAGTISTDEIYDLITTISPDEFVAKAYLMCDVAAYGEDCITTGESYEDFVAQCRDAGFDIVTRLRENTGDWAAVGVCVLPPISEHIDLVEQASRRSLERLGYTLNPAADRFTNAVVTNYYEMATQTNETYTDAIDAAMKGNAGWQLDWCNTVSVPQFRLGLDEELTNVLRDAKFLGDPEEVVVGTASHQLPSTPSDAGSMVVHICVLR